jgi:hypothetical protein
VFASQGEAAVCSPGGLRHIRARCRGGAGATLASNLLPCCYTPCTAQ